MCRRVFCNGIKEAIIRDDPGSIINFKQIVGVLSVEYGISFSDERIRLWMDALKGYDLPSINLAVRSIIRTWTHHRAPRLADVLEAIDGSDEWHAMQHWASIRSMVSNNALSDLFDPVVLQTINMIGGIEGIRNMRLQDMPYLRSQFVKAYIYIKEDLSRDHQLKLTDGNQPDAVTHKKQIPAGTVLIYDGEAYTVQVGGFLFIGSDTFTPDQVLKYVDSGIIKEAA